MTLDISTAAAVRRVQDAALERALVDERDAARYVAFAGALEPLRLDAVESDAIGLLSPLLACTSLAARAGSPGNDSGGMSPSTDGTPVDVTVGATDDPAWSPTGHSPGARVEGAVLAFERFDVDLERAARLAGRSSAEFAALVERNSARDPR